MSYNLYFILVKKKTSMREIWHQKYQYDNSEFLASPIKCSKTTADFIFQAKQTIGENKYK